MFFSKIIISLLLENGVFTGNLRMFYIYIYIYIYIIKKEEKKEV